MRKRVWTPRVILVVILLMWPAVALADNCSGLSDCWGTACAAGAAAAGAGAAAGTFGGGDDSNGNDDDPDDPRDDDDDCYD